MIGCIDFGDSEFGHEYEILIQADICIHAKKTVELGGDVFSIQCELKSVATILLFGVVVTHSIGHLIAGAITITWLVHEESNVCK